MNVKKIGLKHLDYLTDDFGIWQHTKGPVIDRAHGYALDDSARALLLALKIEDFKKAEIYFSFLEDAIGNGKLIIFYDNKRKPLDKVCSEDALGEAYWALAYAVEIGFLRERAEKLIQKIAEKVSNFGDVRGRSYAILGALYVDPGLAKRFVSELSFEYMRNRDMEWDWLEDELNYANAIIPLAFLSAAEVFDDENLKKQGSSMLRFLNAESKEKGYPITVGNKGWYQKLGNKAIFDQQPIDASYQVLANLKAWQLTGEKDFLDEAKSFFMWFWGNNVIQKPLIDEKKESCRDGLWCDGVDVDCGAESTVCFLLAQEEIWPHLQN